MGNRTVVIFENDGIALIKEDKKFAENLYKAILENNLTNDPQKVIGHGKNYITTVCKVVHNSHKDCPMVLKLIGSSAEIFEG